MLDEPQYVKIKNKVQKQKRRQTKWFHSFKKYLLAFICSEENKIRTILNDLNDTL